MDESVSCSFRRSGDGDASPGTTHCGLPFDAGFRKRPMARPMNSPEVPGFTCIIGYAIWGSRSAAGRRGAGGGPAGGRPMIFDMEIGGHQPRCPRFPLAPGRGRIVAGRRVSQ